MFFFFNDTATTEIYTLSLHDALPIFELRAPVLEPRGRVRRGVNRDRDEAHVAPAQLPLDAREGGAERGRSEEHTSELQSRQYLVCRLLLEKKKSLLRSSLPFFFYILF